MNNSKILYLTNETLDSLDDLQKRSIYFDLMRKFIHKGHQITIVAITKGNTKILVDNKTTLILISTSSNKKIRNYIAKGINLFKQKFAIYQSLKKYVNVKDFSIILYASPPFIFNSYIKRAKKINPKLISYLMLKDIFPQNAVDLGVLSKRGIKGLIYKHYRYQEKTLYEISDYIGCMSQANVDYILKHNNIDKNKVEVNPNTIDTSDFVPLDKETVNDLKLQLNLPLNKKILLYGGNLGDPQGIDFFIKVLESNKNRNDILFIIIGNGTNYDKLESYNKLNTNFILIKELPVEQYNQYVSICDAGIILLDYRFTIPNYPSRILSYLQYSKPILMASDETTDMRDLIIKNNFGLWAPSNNVKLFNHNIDVFLKSDNKKLQIFDGVKYLATNFDVKITYAMIINKL